MLDGHGDRRKFRIGVCAKHRRIRIHQRFALAVDHLCAQREERRLAFPAEKLRHIPDAAELKVRQLTASLERQLRTFACRRIFAVGRFPAGPARRQDHCARLDHKEITTARVKANGADHALAVFEKFCHQHTAHTAHTAFVHLAHEIFRHVLAALALVLRWIELHMWQPALRDALVAAIFLLEKATAQTFVILHAIVGLRKQRLHQFLIAEPVVVIDQIFHPVVDVLPGQDDVKITAAHAHQTAPVDWSFVHDQHIQLRRDLLGAICSPKPC